jgi:hypothetical protein
MHGIKARGKSKFVVTDQGSLYLAVVVDLFSRQVVGWSMQPHMQASLVTDALTSYGMRSSMKPQGQLLGQRADRELVGQLESGPAVRPEVRQAAPGDG